MMLMLPNGIVWGFRLAACGSTLFTIALMFDVRTESWFQRVAAFALLLVALGFDIMVWS
jgi:hypothetical protein